MNRPWQIWSAYCAALALVAAAVGWLSLRAWQADQAEHAAAEQASLEESVRLALWRMDSILVPFVAEESARAPWEYRAPRAAPAPQSPEPESRPVRASEPTNLLIERSPRVWINFQIDPDGHASSPQVPDALAQELLAPELVINREIVEMRNRLEALEEFADFDVLAARLPPAGIVLTAAASPPSSVKSPLTQNVEPPLENSTRGSRARGASEYQVRQQLAVNLSNTAVANTKQLDDLSAMTEKDETRVATMTPILVDGRLLLARQVARGPHRWIQGCWLDWSSIRAELRSSVVDLLPDADVQLAEGPAPADQTRLLAALPVQIIPGSLTATPAPGLAPMQISLATTWCALLLAAAAVAVLLRGIMTLSERRADFVSVVTHELRTPLTTFRMYAEMLAEGMVPDEQDRRTYLNTLRTEADRLTHLVENVLAYARLERGGMGGRISSIRVAELMEMVTSRLGDRSTQAGFELNLNVTEAAQSLSVRSDASAVEQILFNLVDNACKYARESANRRIVVRAEIAGQALCISVRDFGPGVPREQQRRLFRPFSRSARDTAADTPGVGLGLALSRRLARDMGGDLIRDKSVTEGTAFVLTLPVLETSNSFDSVPHANQAISRAETDT